MGNYDIYIDSAPVRIEVTGAQGPAGVDDATSAFATNKASIVNADMMAILDSANSNLPKHTLWSVIKSTLKTYFDTFYLAINGALGTPSSGNLSNCTFPTLNQNTTGNAATVSTISGRIIAGANVTITGSGTAGDPYVINFNSGANTVPDRSYSFNGNYYRNPSGGYYFPA